MPDLPESPHSEWCRTFFRSLSEGQMWHDAKSCLLFAKIDGKLKLVGAALGGPPDVDPRERYLTIEKHFNSAGVVVEGWPDDGVLFVPVGSPADKK